MVLMLLLLLLLLLLLVLLSLLVLHSRGLVKGWNANERNRTVLVSVLLARCGGSGHRARLGLRFPTFTHHTTKMAPLPLQSFWKRVVVTIGTENPLEYECRTTVSVNGSPVEYHRFGDDGPGSRDAERRQQAKAHTMP
uniref:Uncharacterized protein n=1 Tax=Anopheles culicifacies TaxID=139723 RepID=A0A182MSK2_9DIPT